MDKLYLLIIGLVILAGYALYAQDGFLAGACLLGVLLISWIGQRESRRLNDEWAALVARKDEELVALQDQLNAMQLELEDEQAHFAAYVRQMHKLQHIADRKLSSRRLS